MIRPVAFLRDSRGAAAAEFALVLPVALLFLLGTIDIGRYFWKINTVEKAVQAGTRYAVTTGIVPLALNEASYVDFACPSKDLAAGDTICRGALGVITCEKSDQAVACRCAESELGAASCPDGVDDAANISDDAFNAIVTRMRVIDAGISSNNVKVRYSGSGLGYAGDPLTDADDNPLSEVSPIVTVEVGSFAFRSISLLGYGITLPGFRYSQTLEDGVGVVAY